MKVNDWLISATKTLESQGVPTARLDSLILLEDTIKKDRAWILANPDTNLNKLCERSVLSQLESWVKRRGGHEPLAYIRAKAEFYGREFKVTPATLQPRPETETMIDLIGNFLREIRPPANHEMVFVDVGTGSGCLAITAKLEWPELHVLATDINKDALKIAKQNAKTLGAKVMFYQGNLLEPIAHRLAGFTHAESEVVFSLSSGVKRTNGTLHEQRKGKTVSGQQATRGVAGSARDHVIGGVWILVCNLPYVPDSHTINKSAMQEPKIAIFGGKDGLDLYRELFEQINKLPAKPKYILSESLPFQHKTLTGIAKKSGYILHQTEDFIQVFIAI